MRHRGSTLDEARTLAEEALTLHLQGLAKDKEPTPEPSSLEAIMDEPENRTGVAILVPARANNKAIRVISPFRPMFSTGSTLPRKRAA